MIATRKLRDLDMSSASGLLVVDGSLYVVADDELELSLYTADGASFVRRVPLFAGGLPGGKQVKAAKPDLEALVLVLPPAGVLALGSGSGPNRQSGVWLPSGSHGPVCRVDLSQIYAALTFVEINIEGAAVAGDKLRLFQRGNGRARENAVVDLDLERVRAALRDGVPLPAAAVGTSHPVDLGDKGGIAWSFTDASPLPDGRTLFSAAAEDTDDPYQDGPCLGAALGILDEDGTVVLFEEIDQPLKIEGVHAFATGEAFLVADVDDPVIPSPLLTARWS